MPLYDFACPVCGVFESLARMSDEEIECACGEQATRLFSPTTAFKVHDGPGDWNVKTADGKWRLKDFQEAQATNADHYDRIEKATGEKVQRPDLFKEALREAKRRGIPLSAGGSGKPQGQIR